MVMKTLSSGRKKCVIQHATSEKHNITQVPKCSVWPDTEWKGNLNENCLNEVKTPKDYLKSKAHAVLHAYKNCF